jgi:hypothetical protein
MTAAVAMVISASPGVAAVLSVDSHVTYTRGAGCGGPFCVHDPNGDIHLTEVFSGEMTGTLSGPYFEHLEFLLHPDGTFDFTATATCGGFNTGTTRCAVGDKLGIIKFTLKGRGRWDPGTFTVHDFRGTWMAKGRPAHATSARNDDLSRTRGHGHFTSNFPHEHFTGTLNLR